MPTAKDALRAGSEALLRTPGDEALTRRVAALLRESGRETEAALLEARVFAFGADF